MPELATKGFVAFNVQDENATAREIRSAFPFGQLRRARSDGFDAVEVQIHSRNPSFRFNFGWIPFGGVEHEVVGHIKQEEVWLTYLDTCNYAYQWPFFLKWFSLSMFLRTRTESDYEELVRKVVPVVDEVDACLRENVVGPHIKRQRP